MFSVYDEYNKLITKRKTYFAGGNTADGFVGKYGEIADENRLERVYIIKGSAGCGKSTFMRDTAQRAEEEGFAVEYYLCGSDPDSLDCIVIDGRIAILDGTPPHPHEMKYPGAKSEIVDFSRFLDKDKAALNADDIVTHTALKSAAYASAYRYIRAAEAIEEERKKLAATAYDNEKARRWALKFAGKLRLKESSDYRERTRLSHGVTMRGLYATDSDISLAETVIGVKDYYSAAPLFMETVRRVLCEKMISHTVSLMPIGSDITAVEIDGSGIVFAVTDEKNVQTTLNTARFTQKSETEKIRPSLRLAGKVERECIRDAVLHLSEAAEHHFALEKIYGDAMDFDSLAQYRRGITDEIIKRLK